MILKIISGRVLSDGSFLIEPDTAKAVIKKVYPKTWSFLTCYIFSIILHQTCEVLQPTTPSPKYF